MGKKIPGYNQCIRPTLLNSVCRLLTPSPIFAPLFKNGIIIFQTRKIQ